ncbi:MAG: TonB-dependent siderophore receptor [Pseudomonadales bacterium]|nr:TonB-dependent siderophore receptor [Pseudomonadales bacterium]
MRHQKSRLSLIISLFASGSLATGVWANEAEMQSDHLEASNQSTTSEPAQELDAITVTGSESGYTAKETSRFNKLDAPIIDTPRSVSVVTRQKIEDRGADSIQDSLSYSSGVLAGPYGFDSRLDTARVRGVSPLKYQDGFQALFGFYNNTRADIYTLENVEVIKGPASVLYGQGALGGIVNSTSKLPREEEKREIQLQYGTFERKQLGLDFTGKLTDSGEWLYRLVGVYRDSDTQVDHVEDNAVVIQPSLTWRPSLDTSITLLANYQDNEGGQSLQFLPNEGTLLPGQLIDSDTFIGEPGWDRYDTEQKSVSVFAEHRLNKMFTVNVNARYTDGEADYKSHWVTYGPNPVINEDGTVLRTIYDAPATSEAFTANTILSADFDTAFVNHHASVGIDYLRATTDTDSYMGYGTGGLINIYQPEYGNLVTPQPVTDTPADVQTQTGFFLRDQLRIQQWLVSLGVRVDQFKKEVKASSLGQASTLIDDTVTTFDAALMYQFSNGIAPYYSYAESFEPLGRDRFNVQLDPKEGTQHEIGVKYQPVGGDALYTVAVFDIVEQNRPVSVGDVPTQQGKVKIRGIELEAQTRLGDFEVQANYSYLDAKNRDAKPETHLSEIPDHLASAWVKYDPEHSQFSAGAGVRHVGENWDGKDTLSTDPYTLFDAMVAYDFGQVELKLNGKNILDKRFVATSQGGRSFYGERRTVKLVASIDI